MKARTTSTYLYLKLQLNFPENGIPGTFDPIHEGHFAIIKRASKLFDEVVVAVAESVEKNPKHSLDERKQLATEMCASLDNVEVKTFDNLLVDFVRSEGAQCVVKGLRNVQDFEYESNMAAINSQLSKEFETIFMICDPEFKEISSTQIRELENLGVDTSSLTRKTHC